MTTTGPRDEAATAGGARWVTVAFLTVGLLNYAYVLVLTRLLDVPSYERFAAGQGLMLWAITVATVSVQWVLAQALARARAAPEAWTAVRFTKMVCAATGLLAGLVVGGVASQFSSLPATITLGLSTFIIFLGTTPMGWLQGHGRMRALSLLTVGENLVKNAAGLALVVIAGLGETGALAAFGIGGLLVLLWWPSVPRSPGRSWRFALAQRDLWRRAVGIGAVQGLVTLVAALDVVVVAMLPARPAAAASYQASAALSRVPLFLASAVGTAFFPSLSSRRPDQALAGRAVRMYLMVAVPAAAILATMPAPVLAVVFPAQYGSMGLLLRYTAVLGLAAGGINIVTTFFQAAGDFRCLGWQLAGLAGYLAAMLAGWQAGGIVGLAIGGAAGAVSALVLLVYRLVRRQGTAALSRAPLVGPLVSIGVLVLVRPYAIGWVALATVVGLAAAVLFLRRPRVPAAAGPAVPAHHLGGKVVRASDEAAVSLLTSAVWREQAPVATDGELRRALVVARRNQVEGRLARAYPEQLPRVEAEVRIASDLFRRNLGEVAGRLERAGIPAVLIKADPAGDHVCSDFDLVVSQRQWVGAFAALTGWYVHSERYWLERSSKVLLYPQVGPALHLHSGVSWFGVPVLTADWLLAHAVPGGAGWLRPAPPDSLRIWLAHALFQNLCLDLSELFAVRELLAPEVITAGREEARREGWQRGFEGALATAREAISRLDRGAPVCVPAPLPVSLSLRAAAEHARHLSAHGQPRVAAREAMLRMPMVIAKRRRLLTG